MCLLARLLTSLSLLPLSASIEFKDIPGGYDFTIDQPTTIHWEPASTNGTVTVELIWAETIPSDEGETIESHLPDTGSYTWTPAEDLSDLHDYTLCLYPDQPPQDFDCLPRFSISGAKNESTPTETPTTPSTSTADAEPTSDISDEDDEKTTADDEALPPATKAGIGGGVGVGVLVIVLGVVGVCWLKRRKQKQTARADPSIPLTSHPNTSTTKTEWDVFEADAQGREYTTTEMPTHAVYEMHSHSTNELPGGGLREMHGSMAPVELPTIEHKFV
ncbi:hypothetical protein BJX70DRAFT_6087 [Aspergillus crustosus]